MLDPDLSALNPGTPGLLLCDPELRERESAIVIRDWDWALNTRARNEISHFLFLVVTLGGELDRVELPARLARNLDRVHLTRSAGDTTRSK